MIALVRGDAQLIPLRDESIHACVTSPPYFGLRDYEVSNRSWPDGWVGQLGLEPTVELYVGHLVEVMREVWRVLRPDGTAWVVLGDSYYCNPPGQRPDHSGPKLQGSRGQQGYGRASAEGKRAGRPRAPETRPSRIGRPSRTRAGDLSPKDRTSLMPDRGRTNKNLVGAPWRVALALQDDGWILRTDVIWNKTNPMPESAKDRPTRAHEYVFLLAKQEQYYWDHDSFQEPATDMDGSGNAERIIPNGGELDSPLLSSHRGRGIPWEGGPGMMRNRRTVWTVSTVPYKRAHYAAFPPHLIAPMIEASCPKGGVVLDPFGGTGTVGRVAQDYGRRSVILDLSGRYLREFAAERTAQKSIEEVLLNFGG